MTNPDSIDEPDGTATDDRRAGIIIASGLYLIRRERGAHAQAVVPPQAAGATCFDRVHPP